MIVDIVDKYCTDDNNPIKNLRLKFRISHTHFAILGTLPPNANKYG